MRGAWQKNNGLRIDHFLVSNSLLNIVKNVNINKDPRGKEKPSDPFALQCFQQANTLIQKNQLACPTIVVHPYDVSMQHFQYKLIRKVQM